MNFKILQVKWEPSIGQSYALLFDKKVETYSSEKEEPLSSVTSEINFVAMDFVTSEEIIVTDVNSRMTYLKGI